jgi:hypothetical protein
MNPEYEEGGLRLFHNDEVGYYRDSRRYSSLWIRPLNSAVKVCPNRPMNMIAPNPQNAPVKEPPQPRPEPKEPPPPGPIDKPPAPPAPPPARFIQ